MPLGIEVKETLESKGFNVKDLWSLPLELTDRQNMRLNTILDEQRKKNGIDTLAVFSPYRMLRDMDRNESFKIYTINSRKDTEYYGEELAGIPIDAPLCHDLQARQGFTLASFIPWFLSSAHVRKIQDQRIFTKHLDRQTNYYIRINKENARAKLSSIELYSDHLDVLMQNESIKTKGIAGVKAIPTINGGDRIVSTDVLEMQAQAYRIGADAIADYARLTNPNWPLETNGLPVYKGIPIQYVKK